MEQIASRSPHNNPEQGCQVGQEKNECPQRLSSGEIPQGNTGHSRGLRATVGHQTRHREGQSAEPGSAWLIRLPGKRLFLASTGPEGVPKSEGTEASQILTSKVASHFCPFALEKVVTLGGQPSTSSLIPFFTNSCHHILLNISCIHQFFCLHYYYS